MAAMATPSDRPRIGCYPGSFNPPTVAHLAIAEAAVQQCRLDRLDLVLSRSALGKEHLGAGGGPSAEDRVRALGALTTGRPWLAITVTDRQLLADIAEGYDVVVLGADKWSQLVDPHWYGGSTDARDTALARLPEVAVAPRPGHAVPDHGTVLRLDDPTHEQVSSTAVRNGRIDWIAPEVARTWPGTEPPCDDAGHDRHH